MTRESDGSGGEPYFAERPRSRSVRRELRFLYRGEMLSFVVDRGIFAAHGLDPGTSLLIESLEVRPTDRVLDLGCGWGPVGVAAAKRATAGRVVLVDVNRRAAHLARENVERNGLTNAEVRVGRSFEPVSGERFDLIASNPPYRAGRELVLELLARAPEHLSPGGRLVIVGKGSQGIRYYQSWLADRCGGAVEVLGRGSGYRVLEARPGSAARPKPRSTPALGRPKISPKPLRRKSFSAAAPRSEGASGPFPDPFDPSGPGDPVKERAPRG